MEFSIGNKEFELIDDENINTVVLYGSWARSENDRYSDIDILIVVNNFIREYNELKKEYAKQLKIPQKWITLYSKESIIKMRQYTSLFLWHLKLESIVLYSREDFLNSILINLPEYNKIADDIVQYKMICKDIKEMSLIKGYAVNYELSLIPALVRNGCILFCYLEGKKIFGRREPVIKFLESYPLFTIREYNELYLHRSNYEESNEKIFSESVLDYINYWTKIVDRIINLLEELIE